MTGIGCILTYVDEYRTRILVLQSRYKFISLHKIDFGGRKIGFVVSTSGLPIIKGVDDFKSGKLPPSP